MRSIPYYDTGSIQPSFMITLMYTANIVSFYFTRTSEAGVLPLIAELLIDRVNTDLNGTDVQCLPSNDLDFQVTFAIHVLGG
jgi:hypothetical protein